MESFGWRGGRRSGGPAGWEDRQESGGAGRGGEAWPRTVVGSRAVVAGRASLKPVFSVLFPASAVAWGTERGADPTAEGSLEQGTDQASQGAGEGGEEAQLARRQRVEAVLLLSRAPLSPRKLSQLAGLADATEARTLVRQLNQSYAEWGRAFRAEEVAGGYQLLTRPQLAPWLRRLGHIPKSVQLTPPAMETMAIVAYRQPVLRADIEAIRGVACGEILRQLMERDLVRISGRSNELGRPYLYSTTKRFLQLFGLQAAEALPAVEISELSDWSDTPASSDPNLEQQPVPGVPEEEFDVSTAVAEVGLEYPGSDEPQLGWAADRSFHPSQIAVAGIDDDPEDDLDDLDDDEDDEEKDVDDFDDDDEWEDDDEEEEDDEDADADEEDVDADAEWEEVDDEWVEEEGEEDEWDDEEEEGDDEDEEDEEEWD